MNDQEYYMEYLKRTDRFPQAIYHMAKRDMVRQAFDSLPLGSSVLDAGCGIGNITGSYCGRYNVVGIDEQPSSIEYCRRTYSGRYMQASLYSVPFPDNTFDAVLFLDAIEHLDRPVFALKELARVLKPGAAILICTMNYKNPLWIILAHTWHRFFGGTCKPYSKDVHPARYTAEILKNHCKGLFQEIRFETRVMNMELFYVGKKIS